MKILYIATSFPEVEYGSTIYTDLAEELNHCGHEIVVAVSEQKKNRKKTVFQLERGFEVLRIVTGNYYDVGFIEKGITSLKIPYIMKKEISRYLKSYTFDLILFEAPPVTNAALVKWAMNKYNCPSYLMLKDIFPQNAVDLNIIKKNSILHRYFEVKEKSLYATATVIGTMSEANKNYIIEHSNVDSGKLSIFPNTKKINNGEFSRKSMTLRNDLEIPHDSTLFLFGGNMGRPQYIKLLEQAIIHFKNNQNVYFLFVGRGTDKHLLETAIKNHQIQNAKVINNLPRDEYEKLLLETDVGLIILNPNFTIPNFPSRILSYMEYGIPVLAATDKCTDLKAMIEKANCGKWVWSGDEQAFFEQIESMSRMSDLKVLGANGFEYMSNEFDVNKSVKLLEEFYEKYRGEHQHV